MCFSRKLISFYLRVKVLSSIFICLRKQEHTQSKAYNYREIIGSCGSAFQKEEKNEKVWLAEGQTKINVFIDPIRQNVTPRIF